MLYEKEIQEKRVLDAALQLFPEDGATMLLVGSFSKKVLGGRKPRPHEIMKGKYSKSSAFKPDPNDSFDPTLKVQANKETQNVYVMNP